MNTLVHKLEELIARRGWAVVSRGEDLPWWVGEQWRLRSEWRPQGFEVYLNFLVHPHDDGAVRMGRERPRGRRQPRPGIYAVSATTALPRDRFEAESVVLTWLEQRAFAHFVDRLDQLRDDAKPSEGADAGD